jgi:short-subunit dehydrogenase
VAAPAVLIPGASRGLGADAARMAARLGAQVALMARSAGDLEQVAAEIEGVDGNELLTCRSPVVSGLRDGQDAYHPRARVD